jgi:valyl-tRNA synthetase
MPHITEEIWQTLTQQPAENPQVLALQSYPEADTNLIDTGLEEQFDLLIGTIRTIRNLRAEADVKPGAKITANLQSDSEKERSILITGEAYIKDLAKVETLTINAPITAENPTENTVESPKESPTNNDIFNSSYWRSLKTIGIILAVLVTLRVAVFVGNTSLRIPIFGSFFETVGLFYVGWFVVRYLLNGKARKELFAKYFPAKETPTESEVETEIEPATTEEQEKEPAPEKENSIAGVVGTVQIVIPLTGVVDVEVLRAKLEKSLNKVEAEVKALTGRLSNSNFVDKAPADVVQTTRNALAEAEKQAEILQERLRTL